jgi:hypothetical protein
LSVRRTTYFITLNNIRHASRWEDWEIKAGKTEDKETKKNYYKRQKKKGR